MTINVFRPLCAALFAMATILPTSLAAQPVKLKVSTNQSIDASAFEAARVLGYFAEEGLEVDVTPIIGGAAGLPALAAGQAQVVASNLISIILGAKNGLPFRIVAAGDATFDNPPDLAGLVVPTASALKTGKDFEGKRLAVNARNGIIWLFARSWVEATGGDPNKVTYAEVPFPQMIDAIRQGRVDGAFVVEPFLSNGVQTNVAKVVGWPYSTVQKRAPISQWVMTQSYIDQNPKVVEGFVRAHNRGADWMNQNRGSERAIEIIANFTKIAPDTVRKAAIPDFVKIMDVEKVSQTIEMMRRHGLMTADDKLDPRTILHSSVLAK